MLLVRLGNARFRPLLQRALMQRVFGAEYLEQLAALHKGRPSGALTDVQEAAS